ncbi:MAG: hypothetical protein AAB433_10750 [Nitrospirota bacterium]
MIALLFVCLLGMQALSIVHSLDEERYLSDLMDRIAPRSLPPSEQAIKVVESLKEKPDIDNPSYFLLPIFGFLRATPRQVMEQGGECGDRSRLVIRLLNVRGIKASKWALYSSEGKSVHATVELEAESGKMVVDPLFGLWFPRSSGGYYGIRELRESPEILHDRIERLLEEGKRPGTSDLRTYPLNDYSYAYAKTINWDKWVGMRMVYNVLRVIVGPVVDNFQRPTFVENPHFMVVIIAAGLQGGLIALYFAVVRIEGNMKRERGWSV